METEPLLHNLQNLREEVSCSVCGTLYTEPKLLPCLHSFCLHCLNGIQETSGRHDIFTCPDPECKTEIRVPSSGDLNELPTNFRLINLLDVLAIKECASKEVKCGNCDKTSGQSLYCFQCCAFWCDECITGHNIIRTNKEHRVLPLQDFQDQDFENVLKRPAFCQMKDHKTEKLKFFCQNCEVAICNTCIVALHDGHPKVLLEETANKRKLDVKSAIEAQKEGIQKNMIKIAKIDEDCARIQEHCNDVKGRTQQFVNNIITVIEEKQQKIIAKVESEAKMSIHRLEEQKKEIEHQVEMSHLAVKKTETFLNRNPNADIMQPNNLFDKLLQEEVSQDDSVEPDNICFCEVDFVENHKLFDIVKAEQIGSLEDQQSASETCRHEYVASEAYLRLHGQNASRMRNVEEEQCHQERDNDHVETRNCQGTDDATKARTVQDDNDSCYKLSNIAEETSKWLANINEEPVSRSAFSEDVESGQFKPVFSFGREGSSNGMFNYPWGVAVNERDEIAVTDHGPNVERVQIFTRDGTHLRSFGRKGDKKGEFNFPTGITFDNNENIIVADNGNNRVQLFSEQGVYLSQFGGKGKLKLNGPLGLSLEDNGNMIVTDNTNKHIKIFSSNGKFLSKIGGKGSFTFPFHCVQYGRYFIVSDRDKHCVKVFDGDGTYRYKFGKKGQGDGEFNEPHCLAVNEEGHLIVCDSMNHRVQVFDLNGNFVTKFGKEGTGLGEFNKPVSTAVLSDGRIVVTDFCNHRVQIFEST